MIPTSTQTINDIICTTTNNAMVKTVETMTEYKWDDIKIDNKMVENSSTQTSISQLISVSTMTDFKEAEESKEHLRKSMLNYNKFSTKIKSQSLTFLFPNLISGALVHMAGI